MIVFLALDNQNGMMLNNRRQSRDSVLNQKMFDMIEDKKLMIHSFSQKLLAKDFANQIIIRDDFIDDAQSGDVCFVENQHLASHVDKISTIYVFRWNRDYLADFTLDIDLSKWHKEVVEDFVGSSHERITLEKYMKI